MGRQLQYISTSNGTFYSVLAQNVTQDSVIECKFLSTDYSNIVGFGEDYADVKLRHWYEGDDMYWYDGGGFIVTSLWTLNEEHTVSLSTSEYKWNGVKVYDVSGTCNIPSTPYFKPEVNGRIYYFKITDNGVDRVNLVAWDENGVLGMKDLVSGNFYTPDSGTWTAGPAAHVFETSKASLKFVASGGTDTFDVEAETTWSASTPSFVTLSPSTGASGTTTVTVTCPSYSGETKRSDVVTLTDADSYTVNVTMKQRGNTQGISNIYLGENQIATADALFLGDTPVTSIYLGEKTVYSSGPFTGLKVKPVSLSFNNNNLTNEFTIKSSENWTITDDSNGWLSYSTTTGSTGETVVSVSATTTQSARTATITITTTNYTGAISVDDTPIQFYDYFRIQDTYFQIPVTPTINTRVECDNVGFASFNNDEFPGVFCIGDEWSDSTISICSYRSINSWIMRFGDSYTTNTTTNITFDQLYDMSIDSEKLVIDGNEYYLYASTFTANNKPLTIGARNDDNSNNVIRMMDGYVGDFRIYDNNVLVMELKPSINNDVYSYYDTVGGVFYAALGNGTITGVTGV